MFFFLSIWHSLLDRTTPAGANAECSMLKQLEAALPRAVELMQQQGELYETDFVELQVPQDEGHDKVRDLMPLGRRRALVLTSEALAARCAEQNAAKEKAAAKKATAAERQKALKESRSIHENALEYGPLNEMSERTEAERADPDVDCLLCCVSYYALADHGLAANMQKKWRQCEHCDCWLCPFCVKNLPGKQGHERSCGKRRERHAAAEEE